MVDDRLGRAEHWSGRGPGSARRPQALRLDDPGAPRRLALFARSRHLGHRAGLTLAWCKGARNGFRAPWRNGKRRGFKILRLERDIPVRVREGPQGIRGRAAHDLLTVASPPPTLHGGFASAQPEQVRIWVPPPSPSGD